MFTATSKKYTYPVMDNTKNLWKLFYKGDNSPIYLEHLKYEDQETKTHIYFYSENGKLKTKIINHS